MSTDSQPVDSLRISLLGPLEVRRDSDLLRVGGLKPRIVLATLAIDVRHTVPVSDLIEALWPGEPPDKATATLQAHVSGLRRTLDRGGEGTSCIVNRPPGYVLELPRDSIDVTEFETLASRAGRLAADGRHSEASALFARAEALWRGPALADLRDQHALMGPAVALDEARLAAVEARINADLQRGAHREVIPELRTLTDAHPLREDLWGSLMLALYRAGRQADALGVYRQARAALVEELGIEPGPGLQTLEQAVLAQSPDLDRVDPPAWASDEGVVGTTLIGTSGRAPDAVLVTSEGERLRIGARCTIGRHPESSVVLEDPKASRHHATIRATARGYVLRDLGSTNGTRVDGTEVDEHPLRSGDEIQIGDTVLRYEPG